MYVILFVIVLILNVFGVIVRYDIASECNGKLAYEHLSSRCGCSVVHSQVWYSLSLFPHNMSQVG